MPSPTDREVEGARPPTATHGPEIDAAMAHRPRLVTPDDIGEVVHGAGPVGRFNNRLALLITRAVGTMWAGYLFALISFISLPQALAAFTRGETLVGITWLSQSFLQLVLLPVIIVGQNIISASQDARAEADHETLTALQQLNVRQLQILKHEQKILDVLYAAGGPPPPQVPSASDA